MAPRFYAAPAQISGFFGAVLGSSGVAFVRAMVWNVAAICGHFACFGLYDGVVNKFRSGSCHLLFLEIRLQSCVVTQLSFLFCKAS